SPPPRSSATSAPAPSSRSAASRPSPPEPRRPSHRIGGLPVAVSRFPLSVGPCTRLGVHENTLAPFLARQHGVVTRSQARRAGLSDRQIDRCLTSGSLVAVHRGVFRHATHPETFRSRVQAAVLALGPGAAASHRSAVGLIGLTSLDVRLAEVSWPHRSPRR